MSGMWLARAERLRRHQAVVSPPGARDRRWSCNNEGENDPSVKRVVTLATGVSVLQSGVRPRPYSLEIGGQICWPLGSLTTNLSHQTVEILFHQRAARIAWNTPPHPIARNWWCTSPGVDIYGKSRSLPVKQDPLRKSANLYRKFTTHANCIWMPLSLF
jgi:hypothetical protein